MDDGIAEMVAINGLSFLARDADVLTRFLSLTGLDPSTLRRSVIDRSFLVGVLDYFLSDEPLLMAYAVEADIKPTDIALARVALGGTENP
jgi:Protein of unknown function (DUF3572)